MGKFGYTELMVTAVAEGNWALRERVLAPQKPKPVSTWRPLGSSQS